MIKIHYYKKIILNNLKILLNIIFKNIVKAYYK